MLCIGIWGENLEEQTIGQMRYFVEQYCPKISFFYATETSMSEVYAKAKAQKGAVLVIPLGEKRLAYCKEQGILFDIFLYLGKGHRQETMQVKEEGIVVVNADDRRVVSGIGAAKKRLITCGINQRAMVTVSSLEEPIATEQGGHMQCCLQKTIETVSGKQLEPQEFSIQMKEGEKSVSGALAAITALMAADVELGMIE